MDERVRELLDQARDTAVTVGEAAGVTARYAARRAGQTMDLAKLNLKIFDLKTDVNCLLRQIGQSVYDTHLGIAGDPVDGLLAQVDEKNRAIGALRDRIATLKECRACPGCGAACAREDKYCKGCGMQL